MEAILPPGTSRPAHVGPRFFARACRRGAGPGSAPQSNRSRGARAAKQNAEAQSLAHNEELRLALVRLRKLPPERYTDEQWQVLAATVELLPRAAAHLKLVFAERNETDFTEIAQGAVRALGTIDEPTDLLLALDTRIQHILVDEFQDTSVSQWELLTLLTSGWQPNDGRTLFLVGDPMQSIYRWREAEVALFLDAWQGGLGTVELERLTLSTNFRSQREGREEEEIEFSWAGETARHVGSVVHRWLQRIADDELRGRDATRVDVLRPRYLQELRRRGLPLTEAEIASHLAATALIRTLADERGRWVLSPHSDAQSEYRIRAYGVGLARSYVIDRVFKDDEGRYWVVDYKTSRHEGTDLDAFLDRERTRYAAQMESYAKAIRGSHLGLYFPMSSGWRHWKPVR